MGNVLLARILEYFNGTLFLDDNYRFCVFFILHYQNFGDYSLEEVANELKTTPESILNFLKYKILSIKIYQFILEEIFINSNKLFKFFFEFIKFQFGKSIYLFKCFYKLFYFINLKVYGKNMSYCYNSLQTKLLNKLVQVDDNFTKNIGKGKLLNSINSDVIDIGDMCNQISELFTTIIQVIIVCIISVIMKNIRA